MSLPPTHKPKEQHENVERDIRGTVRGEIQGRRSSNDVRQSNQESSTGSTQIRQQTPGTNVAGADGQARRLTLPWLGSFAADPFDKRFCVNMRWTPLGLAVQTFYALREQLKTEAPDILEFLERHDNE